MMVVASTDWPDAHLGSRQPVPMPRHRTLPLCVFAAGREAFDVIVQTDDPEDAVVMVWRDLPLEANGWDLGRMIARLVRIDPGGRRIWKVSRS